MQRFTQWCGITHGHAMSPDPTGSWVLHKDHVAALTAETTARQEAAERATAFRHECARLAARLADEAIARQEAERKYDELKAKALELAGEAEWAAAEVVRLRAEIATLRALVPTAAEIDEHTQFRGPLP